MRSLSTKDAISSSSPEQPLRPRISPTAISVADAALLLKKLGGDPISETMIEADIAVGVTRKIDGNMNLVHYTVWLLLTGLRRET